MLILLSYLQGLNEVMVVLHFGFVVGHQRGFRVHLQLPRERWEALGCGEEEKMEKRRSAAMALPNSLLFRRSHSKH
jgi:hypothetical protein